MVVLSIIARVRLDKREQFIEAARSLAKETRLETGSLRCAFSTDIDDPSLFYMTQECESQEALQSHFATAHMAAFLSAVTRLLADEVLIRRFVAE